MKTIITIKANHFNAIFKAAATKDVRYYLNGAYLDIENNVLVGTNGHIAVTAPIEIEQGENIKSVILARPQIMPKKADDYVYIHIDNETNDVMYHYHGKKMIVVCGGIVDGIYPDYARVMKVSDRGSQEKIAFNSQLIEPIQKALKSTGIILNLAADVLSTIDIKFLNEPDINCVLMPFRSSAYE